MEKRVAKGDAAHGSNQDRWLLTYADLITLLMVFFIVMYAVSQADLEKFGKLSAAMQQAFSPGSVLPGGASTVGEGTGQHMTTALMRDLQSFQQEFGVFNEQGDGIGGVSVEMSREGLVIRVSGNILFESGKATLQPSSQELLRVLVGRLRTMPNQVRVEGHTDNIPLSTALYASNWELSTARAIALVRYLSEAGIAPRRLGAVGYGEFRPLASNDTREGRAKNRRVDIVVIYPEALANWQSLLAEEKPSQEVQTR